MRNSLFTSLPGLYSLQCVNNYHFLACHVPILALRFGILSLNGLFRLIPISQLSLYLDGGGGTRVNKTCTMMIFLERGLFSALFNAKMDIVRQIVCFLHAGKEMVRTRECCLSCQKNEFENQVARLR